MLTRCDFDFAAWRYQRSQGPAAAADLLEGVGGEFLSSEESGRNNRLVLIFACLHFG